MSTESKKRKRGRLGKCDVCKTTDASYTCPRCETVSCSLNCVKKHKKDLDCDGVRVQTKYVSADKMDESNVLSDYRLLENVKRCIEEAELRRDSLEIPQEAVVGSTSDELNQIVQQQGAHCSSENVDKNKLSKIRKTKLVQAVARGGNTKAAAMETLIKVAFIRGISVCSLPERFEKHWENTSFFMPKENCIYWHLKISFINANFYTLTLDECPETMKLEEVVKGCIRRSENYWKNKALDDPLEIYRVTDFSKISVLMSADKVPNNQKKFYILDMSKSLCENFLGKCIVEFPQLCIALEDCYTVSAVQDSVAHNFFGGHFDSDKEEEPQNEFERILKKKMTTRKKLTTNKTRSGFRNDESDRESGELTDSSDSSSHDSFFSDSDSHDDSSEEELFKESEFRSVYKDLLATFDSDVNHLKRNLK